MAKVSNAAKPMPFPGESPTVALAMAAGQKYGLHEAQEKPARARPKRKAAAKKSAQPARKAKAAKPARAKKSR
jgi:hypothetical protein